MNSKSQCYYHEISFDPQQALTRFTTDTTLQSSIEASQIKSSLMDSLIELSEDCLTKKQREVFFLKLQGKTTIAMGQILGIAQYSAWERLHRALNRLRKRAEKDPAAQQLLHDLQDLND